MELRFDLQGVIYFSNQKLNTLLEFDQNPTKLYYDYYYFVHYHYYYY